MGLAAIDWIFIAIISFFAIFAAIKGFVREIFNKLSWIFAILGGLLFAKFLQPFIFSFINSIFFSYILSFVVLFLIIFLIVQVVKVLVSQLFKGEIMAGLDRALGFLFGLLEGFTLVLLIIYIIDIQTIKPASEFMGNSLFYNYLLPIIKSTALSINPEVINNV